MMELTRAPETPFMDERLPGMSPLSMADWLQRDEAFAAQMAYRDELVGREAEIVLKGEGAPGGGELLALVLDTLAAHDDGYEASGARVRRPDGVVVEIDRARPFATLARLVQEDLLILSKEEGADEHRLTGGALLFPSRWSFEEKMGRPLMAIHDVVPAYDADLGRRVQRLFDVLRSERPLVRANWLVHPTPELFQPKTYAGPKRDKELGEAFWLRTERQSLLKLEETGDVVFSIKTVVTPIEALSAEERTGLRTALTEQSVAMRDYHGGEAHTVAAVEALEALSG